MHTVNRTTIQAPVEIVYALAADIARWPQLLSHYRYVSMVARESPSSPRVARMSARHLGVPVVWTSTQVLDEERALIRYHHVAGITAGMDVEWRIDPKGNGCDVSIAHDLDEPGMLLKMPFARFVAGNVFVSGIADRTLAGIKRHAEVQAAS